MNAFLLYGKRDIRHSELTYPNAAANEVVVKVKCVGICGSDVHYYQDGKIGSFIPQAPFALGHELAGIIDQESSLYPNLKKGTRISINPSHPCKTCSYCKQGNFNICPSMKYIGSASVFPHINGGFSEYIRISAENCFVLPDHIGYAEATLFEPLSVALHALSKADNLSGKSVLITGAGTIGQLTQMACRHYGATTVITDIQPSKLELAKRLGVAAALNPRNPDFEKEITAIEPNGFDVLFEASGAPGILCDSVQYLKKGGKVIQLGTGHEGNPFPYSSFMKNELSFQSSFRFSLEYSQAFDLVVNKEIDLTQIITDRFPFESIPEAMRKASESKEDIKIIVENSN